MQQPPLWQANYKSMSPAQLAFTSIVGDECLPIWFGELTGTPMLVTPLKGTVAVTQDVTYADAIKRLAHGQKTNRTSTHSSSSALYHTAFQKPAKGATPWD